MFHKLDVTITAVQRPELLYETLTSFVDNLFYPHCDLRVIINIDPVGGYPSSDIKFHDFLFHGADTISNFAKKANFAKAFKWTWGQVEADWVFHLEDDWKLVKQVDIRDMMKILEDEEDLALLRLPQFVSTEDKMKNWNLFYPWNGKYFECPKDLRQTAGFCGHPSLIKGEFVKRCRKHLLTDRNPEKQFHGGNGPLVEEVLKWRYGVYGKPNESFYIQDLGRTWKSKNNWKKEGASAHFMRWEKNEKEAR